ncbi:MULTISPECIES: class I SAM-dependent methyltransferase [unclassified Pseudomonas]|uniref:class I SAM-dependent methyltransferase n=1 Tax=unclassified Pseudomonas TaxID=196821 RepID=UPI002448678D|nr:MULTISPECIES: class I SAM-dependent methyltransferase [unclassified Pseudomonas]MDG9929217.1 class I SAM-dependent methyltransferase [Pseudomonas sp. GD04042]MDH0484777.1 class I SAM-dependent methyltransferase [Pseudomonas sp. GD04015]MDH0605041.1 class I SAM-dependent methyltransferase [Pseudomonas sp. GD03869]
MLETLRLRYPAVLALIAQCLALAGVAAVLLVAARLGDWRPTLWQAAVAQGALAAAFGHWLGLRRWWLPLNLAFVPGLLALQSREWPAWWFLAAFLLLLLINWNSFRERVPLYLSGADTRQRLSRRLATLPEDFRFVDLGCGLGGTLAQLARDYPKARLVGVETAPLVFLLAWLRCLPYRNCTVRYRSLWREDLSCHDVAYCFLSPAPMAELWAKVQREMRPGSLLISNTFEIPGAPAREVIELNDWRDSRLLLWHL